MPARIPATPSHLRPTAALAALIALAGVLPARAQVATTTTATRGPDVLGLAGVAGDVASAALRGDTQGMIDALPPPSAGLAGAMGVMALSRWGRRSGLTAGGANLVFDLFFFTSVAAIPLIYGLSMFGDSEVRPEALDSSVELDARVYLLDYAKSSPLTGAFQREVEGLGIGYDFAVRYLHPEWGLLLGGELTFQESEIDGNDYINLTGFFVKVDAKVGLDLARLIGTLTDTRWIKSHRLSARAGPSVFHNWVVMGQDVGAFSTDARDEDLNRLVGLATGVGIEAVAELDVDLGFLGGINVTAQYGTYPALSFPPILGNDAALVTLVGFDDLQGGDTYTWQKISVTLDLPLIGFAQDGTLNIGGQLGKLEAGTGASVNNRGLSIGGSWRW